MLHFCQKLTPELISLEETDILYLEEEEEEEEKEELVGWFVLFNDTWSQ